ncbi:hypothetical protein LINGRAHAP2_LOCUS20144 [Linum grandiflorum]
MARGPDVTAEGPRTRGGRIPTPARVVARRRKVVTQSFKRGGPKRDTKEDERDYMKLGAHGWGSDEDSIGDEVNYPVFRPDRDLDNVKMTFGMLFASLSDFKLACQALAVQQRRGILFPKNDKLRVRCVCNNECGFKLYAMRLSDSDVMLLRTGNLVHSEFCPVDEDLRAAAANSTYLARKYLDEFRDDPEFKCEMLLNNHNEAFNKSILEAQEMPILSCLEDIRSKDPTAYVDPIFKNAEPSNSAAAPSSPPAATPSTATTNPSNFMPNP